MSQSHLVSLLAAGVVAACTCLAGAAEVTVLDGGTLRYDGRTVRIWGIKAPGKSETCKTSTGVDWRCGERAFQQLSAVSADDTFSCEGRESDFVVCTAGSLDVGRLMVKEGLARAWQAYKDVEAEAREAGIGVWE